MSMTFFLKWIAPLLAVLVVIGTVYGIGRLDSDHKAELAKVTSELTVAKDTLKRTEDARAADNVAAGVNAAKITILSSNIDGLNAYASALQDANRECLSGADTDQLRQLWK